MKFIFFLLFHFNVYNGFLQFDLDSKLNDVITNLNISHFVHLNNDQITSDHCSLIKSTFPQIDPEAFMNVSQIINYHGYPVEEHTVVTSDGYVLKIQRIPHGKNGLLLDRRKPVLLQHGLLTSSVSWVLNTPERNLPYILADAGYDVWLGNVRGNVYGLNNTKLSPKDLKFWEFSFDEMAKYDLTSVIDTIVNVTQFEQIYYVGHSMGTTMLFALLSTKPEYNKIIKAGFQLAPVTVVNNIKGALPFVSRFASEVEWLYRLLGIGKFALPPQIDHILAETICDSPLRIVCESVLFLICGFDYSQTNTTRLPLYIYLLPDAASLQNVIHYAQLIKSKQFQFYDFGVKGNIKHYNQSTPPIYDLSKIETPIGIYWGSNDYLADPIDVLDLVTKLQNVIEVYHVPYDKFNHLDFILAIDVKELLFNKLLDTMAKIWK